MHEALSTVRKGRPIVSPNEGFRRQLEVFHKCEFTISPEHPEFISYKEELEKKRQERRDFFRMFIAQHDENGHSNKMENGLILINAPTSPMDID